MVVKAELLGKLYISMELVQYDTVFLLLLFIEESACAAHELQAVYVYMRMADPSQL